MARGYLNLIINNDEFVPLGQCSRNMQMKLRTDNRQKMQLIDVNGISWHSQYIYCLAKAIHYALGFSSSIDSITWLNVRLTINLLESLSANRQVQSYRARKDRSP
ncbi:MAG: hypothetical protein ACI8XG_001972 [Congregibacter sp.]